MEIGDGFLCFSMLPFISDSLWITNSYRADRSVSLSTTLSDPEMGQFWIGVPSLRKLVGYRLTIDEC